jgi:hypothetical protein
MVFLVFCSREICDNMIQSEVAEGRISGGKIPLVVIFLLLHLALTAQEFGGNPTSARWQQVTSPVASVIYPKGFDSVASRIAHQSMAMYKQQQATIGPSLRKVNILLQGQTTFSNAYVALGPYRSEFYMMPPQDPFGVGSLGWSDNLSLHEFRHVQQYSNYRVGLSKAVSVLFGQQAQALFNAMSVPDWFFEGDAVWTETALSGQGRGRLPQFFSAIQSVDASGRKPTWMQWRNGSLRSLYPNHYELGYLVVAYGREKYGDTVWNRIGRDAAAFRSLFYPFQKAVKRQTGVSYNQFTLDALNYFRQQWRQQPVSQVQWQTSVVKGDVPSYENPYPTEDGGIVALKTSYRRIPQIVKINVQGKEERIDTRDIGTDGYFSYRNGRIAYSSYKPDPRWGNVQYSLVRVQDIKTRERKTISHKSKLFSPDVDASGERVVAAEVDPLAPSRLVVIDFYGAEMAAFTATGGWVFSHPKFSSNGQSVIAPARLPDGRMGIYLWPIGSPTGKWLLEPANTVLGFPVVAGDTLYLSMNNGTSDALWSLDMNTGARQLLAAYPTGVYQGFVRNGAVYATYFTADGYRIGKHPQAPIPATSMAPLQTLYVSKTFAQKTNLAQMHFTTDSGTHYSKAHGFLNIHSLLPYVSESELTLQAQSQNVLNTLQGNLSYTYNNNETSHKAGVEALYGGWYIQPFVTGSQTWNRDVRLNADTVFNYNETEAGLGLRLPLNLTFGRYYRSLTLQSAVYTDQVRWQGAAKQLAADQRFYYLSTRFAYTAQIQKARQQIYPRFGYSVLLDYKNMVDKHKSQQFLASGALYLPGIGINHSLVVTASAQARDTFNQYIFSNAFPFSRGYTEVNFPRMWRVGVNYHLPLFYPDWGFGQLAYFLRVRANLFYDYTQVKSLRTGLTCPFSSAGVETYFDMRVWNQLPLTFGVRYTRLLDNEFRGTTQPSQWELILPVNLY